MRTITTAAATVGLLVLAGCSSSETSAGKASTTSTTTVATSSSSAPSDTRTPAAAAEDEPSLDSASGVIEVPFGMVYGYGVKADGTVQDLSVSSMQCGLTVLKKAQRNPEPGSDDVDYPAKPGKQFCVVKGLSKNTGNQPIEMLPYLNQVRGSDGKTYQQSDDDQFASARVQPDESWTSPGYVMDALNPGDQVKWINVYQMPSGVTPKAVIVQAYMSDVPEALLLLPAPTS